MKEIRPYFPDIALSSIRCRKKAAPLKVSIRADADNFFGGEVFAKKVTTQMTSFPLAGERFGTVCCVISVLLCSSLIVVPAFADWFDVHLAVLAPLVACLCYGASLSTLLDQCFKNLAGVLIGGTASLLWILVLRIIAKTSNGSLDYNQYIAVFTFLPWLTAFHYLIPRSHVSFPFVPLLFTTLVMYCDENDYPESAPFRAMLAGILGALISGLVGVAVDYAPSGGTLGGSCNSKDLEEEMWMYYDVLLDEVVSEGPTEILETRRNRCLCSLDRYSKECRTDKRLTILTECFEALLAVEVILRRVKSAEPIPSEKSQMLVELKSDRLASCADSFRHTCMQLEKRNGSDVEPLRYTAFLEFVPLFLKGMDSSTRQQRPNLLTHLSTRVEPYVKAIKCWSITYSRTRLIESLRFSIVFSGLSAMLTYWDARDSTVDTYAMWAFLPGLILADRVTSMGQAIVEGSRIFAESLIGSGIGFACLLIDSGVRVSSLFELLIVLLLGLTIRSYSHYPGLILILSWIQCMLGNAGSDPSHNNGEDLNTLWRVGLYRMAIISFSTFVSGLSFVVIPTCFSTHGIQKDIDQWISLGKDRVMNLPCAFGSFSIAFEERLAWSKAEQWCVKPLMYLPNKSHLADVYCAVAAVSTCERFPQKIDEDSREMELVQKSIKQFLADLQTTAKPRSIKPSTRELISALSQAKKSYSCSRSFLFAILRATALSEFGKSLIPFEAFLSIQEDIDV